MMLRKIGLLSCLIILFLNPLWCFAEVVYVSQYPPQQSSDYVKATNFLQTFGIPYFATDPSKPLTGTSDRNVWTVQYDNANQRFHIDLGTAKTVKRIYYENYCSYSGSTNFGVRNFTLWGSNSSADFADLVYANNGTWVQLTTPQTTFDQHIDAEQVDPKYITVTNLNAYRYYAFKFADNHGNSTFIGVRRIELQIGNTPPGPGTSLKYIKKKKGISFMF